MNAYRGVFYVSATTYTDSSLNVTLGGAVAPSQPLAESVESNGQTDSRQRGSEPHVSSYPEILPSLRRRTDLQFNKSQCHLFSFYTFS